jgi:alanine racemase
LKIPFQDTASIENAISCLMALLYFDYDIATIQSRMLLLFPVEMRLKVKVNNRNYLQSIALISESQKQFFDIFKAMLYL